VTAYVYDDTLTVLPIHHSAGLHSARSALPVDDARVEFPSGSHWRPWCAV